MGSRDQGKKLIIVLVSYRTGYGGDSIEMVDADDGTVLAEFDESGEVWNVDPRVAHALRHAVKEMPDWLVRRSMTIGPDEWRRRFDRWMRSEEESEPVYYGVWKP